MLGNDLALFAHLMRRAGFGATREELLAFAARGYEDVVEDLLHPERSPEIEEDLLQRYNGWDHNNPGGASHWLYRMVNTKRPLEEKIALFWHHVFATGNNKSEHVPAHDRQIAMFRRVGLSDLRSILVELSRDPAMIFWLDNNENHRDEPNENYGRELLELFSMGVGNYTEEDIKMAGRAFTGWTFEQPIPLYTTGLYPVEFVYREEDHDDSVKTFLGETGRFNGEDIIDIVVKKPATARFIGRHLYNFFVADEPQVPAWNNVPPQDPEAIETLAEAYVDSGGEVRSVLRVLLNSDFFKEARFKRVKCPAELVVGAIKLAGAHRFPTPGFAGNAQATITMGQQLLNPPSVEGWHTGQEWINGGTLNERVNFAVNEVGDANKPGVRACVDQLASEVNPVSPQEFVDKCLDMVGPIEVSPKTRDGLRRYAESCGELRFGNPAEREENEARVVRMLQLIVATREYQFA